MLAKIPKTLYDGRVRKVKFGVFIVVFFLSLFYLNMPDAIAATISICPQTTVTIDLQPTFNTTVSINLPKFENYRYKMRINGLEIEGSLVSGTKDESANWKWTFNLGKFIPGEYPFELSTRTGTYCKGILTVPDGGQGGKVSSAIREGREVEFIPSNPKGTDSIQAVVTNLQEDGRFIMRILRRASSGEVIQDTEKFECQNSKDKTITFLINPLNEGEWHVTIWKMQNNNSGSCFLPQVFSNKDFNEIGYGIIKISETLQPTPIPTEPPSSLPPCAQWALLDGATMSPKDPRYSDPDFKDRKCIAVGTAIGDISTEPQGFVRRIFSLVLGLAGGIALILIILSGYKMMASQGNPEALSAARDQLISTIIGLLFIIFSFVILQVIGVDILRIPGFGK